MTKHLAFTFFFLLCLGLTAQDAPSTITGMPLRNVGPAFVSGRIADIAIDPNDYHTWYVAVGSGGVWKTENSGVTWDPIFDDYPSYSTGCITVDPNNNARIWLGTGENVGGRHVGYGDGVYRSDDAGKSWKNVGLKASEHISEIIVHPENSDVVWVAAQGPLWSKGGERGLYLTTDGGATWTKTLGDDEWTGVTDIMLDPRNPDVLYAATWQRHRTVANYLGSGPGSGIHRSRDGGRTWEKLTTGLPQSNMGKIGIAISPQNPDVVYAAITLERTTGGVWRSENQGASWTKMSNTVSTGTGPHYYQELYASPHQFDRLYLMNVRVLVSEDGGANFAQMPEERKHSDNHAIAFRHDDPDYLLVGTDAGLYESFDLGQHWRFIDNMPITQYYKLSVDNSEPFYRIFGGTQDNGSHGGPSRTDSEAGILNGDWYKILGADGYDTATEPGNNDIVYAETQEGGLHRIDLKTGESVNIQPQPGADDPHERYNWDAPIVVSPHDPARLYYGSYRVWRSDSRGNDWTPVSPDLTRNEERIALPIMGGQQSWDNAWDVRAMSQYNTITSLAESPVREGLLWAGTDDGILQVSQDGGERWKKIMVSELPGVPERAFINDIKADRFDANTVYVSLDNHKEGDFKPYLFKSTDLGESWTNLAANLPDRTLIWRLVQDFEKPDLLFIGTEFGIYASLNGGAEWKKLAGTPTIPFRDLEIQERENDLVGASFGRSFWILDDYSPLREMTDANLEEEAYLFTPRDTWWYAPRDNDPGVGANVYAAANPEFGAVFTYHLKEGFTSQKKERQDRERELGEAEQDIAFPGYDALDAELAEEAPKIWLTVYDADGEVVRKIEGDTGAGLHRTAWDLRYPSIFAIRPGQSGGGRSRWNSGPMAAPGTYTVTLAREAAGEVEQLAGPVEFTVKALREGSIAQPDAAAYQAFAAEVKEVQDKLAQVQEFMGEAADQLTALETAVERSSAEPGTLSKELYALRQELRSLERELNGSPSRNEIGEYSEPSVTDRFYTAYRGLSTTYGPTGNNRRSLEMAAGELDRLLPRIQELRDERIPALQKEVRGVGAPYIIGAGSDR